jgi:flagellar motility protein MotE (MotC chaperone)
LIAVLLVGSAILRFGNDAGSALAQATSGAKSNPGHLPESTAMTPHSGDMSKRPDRGEIGRLMTALQEREKRVSQREKQIEMRSKALAVADEEILQRLQALEKAEVTLRGTLSLADGAAENDLARLTAVYENMKPKDAAALFGEMEPDFAAGFLARMRPDSAAAVMAGLPADTAYAISVILAGRNSNVPKS